MKRLTAIWLMIVLAGASALHAAVYTWDNQTGDDAWTNPLNWSTDSGLPGKADTVVFDNTRIGRCRVESNAVVAALTITNTTGTVEFDIPAGYVLAPTTYRQGYASPVDNRVVMSGGGTFAPSGDVWVAGNDATTIRMNKAVLVLSNLVFDCSELNTINAPLNVYNGGATTGILDLANATIVWRGNTNALVAKGSLIQCGTGNGNLGSWFLPGTLTNITVKGALFHVGSYRANAGISIVNFGTNCALRSITVSNVFQIAACRFVYATNGVTTTGFPVNLDLTIGAPGKPGALVYGLGYNTPQTNWMGSFNSFHAWLSQLSIAQNNNNGAGSNRSELDLSDSSVTNVEGSITRDRVTIPDILIGGVGGSPGIPTGILRLPSSVTNVVCNSLSLGYVTATPAAPNSLIDFGTNTRPVTLVVSSNLSLGYAEFTHVTLAGVTNAFFYPGSRLFVGLPGVKGDVKHGIANSGYRSSFGKGLQDVVMYASNLTVGMSGSVNGLHSITSDFRTASRFFVDVENAISIGMGIGDLVNVYFPPGTASCTTLTIGQNDPASYNYRGILELSNTVFVVKQTALVKETGVVTSFVNGVSSGLDIGTTNLWLEDVSTIAGTLDYGRMDIRFVSDPVNPGAPYWGLRMKGNGTGVIQTLTETNATYPYRRLTWNTNGLSEKAAARFGIFYDSVRNLTYLGVIPEVRGVMILVR